MTRICVSGRLVNSAQWRVLPRRFLRHTVASDEPQELLVARPMKLEPVNLWQSPHRGLAPKAPLPTRTFAVQSLLAYHP